MYLMLEQLVEGDASLAKSPQVLDGRVCCGIKHIGGRSGANQNQHAQPYACKELSLLDGIYVWKQVARRRHIR